MGRIQQNVTRTLEEPKEGGVAGIKQREGKEWELGVLGRGQIMRGALYFRLFYGL